MLFFSFEFHPQLRETNRLSRVQSSALIQMIKATCFRELRSVSQTLGRQTGTSHTQIAEQCHHRAEHTVGWHCLLHATLTDTHLYPFHIHEVDIQCQNNLRICSHISPCSYTSFVFQGFEISLNISAANTMKWKKWELICGVFLDNISDTRNVKIAKLELQLN